MFVSMRESITYCESSWYDVPCELVIDDSGV